MKIKLRDGITIEKIGDSNIVIRVGEKRAYIAATTLNEIAEQNDIPYFNINNAILDMLIARRNKHE